MSLPMERRLKSKCEKHKNQTPYSCKATSY